MRLSLSDEEALTFDQRERQREVFTRVDKVAELSQDTINALESPPKPPSPLQGEFSYCFTASNRRNGILSSLWVFLSLLFEGNALI